MKVTKQVVVIMGSKADRVTAEAVKASLASFNIPCDLRIASAHKTPAALLDMLSNYEESGQVGAYITIAGRSNALSGMVDAAVLAPVIACPPRSDFLAQDIFSSLRMPSGVCAGVVLEPANAALLAAKILGIADPVLRAEIDSYHQKLETVIKTDDQELQDQA
jgi:phosphoribosylaminoimidazole carboxylase PurE protein